MLHYVRQPDRRGAAAVEFAIVAPIAFALIFGLIIGALGIFRYQQMSALAREGARYASVRGTVHEKDTSQTAVTATDVSNYVRGRAVALDLSKFQCNVTWNTSNDPYRVDFNNGTTTVTTNTVTVAVSYTWIPEGYFVGPITLSSTSTMPMSY